MADEVPVHPVQTRGNSRGGKVSQVVSLRAYEAYCALFGPQEALITGECRGGFGANELIGFLYAMTFPREQWRVRFDEALTGMENI